MNLNKAIDDIVGQLKTFMGDKKAIIGLSGGIDSTVIAYLCVKALGKENVIGVSMPCASSTNQNFNISSGESVRDARKVADELGIEVIGKNIAPTIISLTSHRGGRFSDLTLGNAMARLRMVTLYLYANEFNGMVIGTTNKTEAEIGYITKYGDGAVDVEPIADLYKTEVWEVGRILGVPEQIIKKSPTANLWEAQTDEGEFGMTYAEMDDILVAIEDGSPEMILGVVARFGESKVRSVISRMRASEHKRHMPPSFKLRD